MLSGIILAVSSFNFNFGDVLASWEQAGFFSYILPFLLIFALVFGILSRTIFQDNKAINAIIALAVALISIQSTRVSEFFSLIFPKLGIGLAIILAILILIGLFSDPTDEEGKRKMNYVLLGIGFIIFIVILVQTSGSLGLPVAQWLTANWPVVIGMVFILLIVGIIVGVGGKGGGGGAKKHRWVKIEE